jgi:hypothetical protein
VHVKACLARRCIPKAWGWLRWHSYLHLGRPTALRLRDIILLVCCPPCGKQCKNWWPGISGMSHQGTSPISIPICLQTRQVHINRDAPCDYTYTGRSGKQFSYTSAFLGIERASDSTSWDIRKDAKPHGLGGTTLAKVDLANYTHTNRRNAGGVYGQGPSTEGHFITPAVLPGCTRSHRGTGWECMLYTGVCAILISGKFPITVLQVLQEVLCMEQQWCDRNQPSIHPQKVQHQDQHFVKAGNLDKIC